MSVTLENTIWQAQRRQAFIAIVAFVLPSAGFFAFHAVQPWIQEERNPQLILVSMMPASLALFFAVACVLGIREIFRWRGRWQVDRDGVEYSHGQVRKRVRWDDLDAVWWGPRFAVFRSGTTDVRLPYFQADQTAAGAQTLVITCIGNRFRFPECDVKSKPISLRIVAALLVIAGCFAAADMVIGALILSCVAFLYVALQRTGEKRFGSWLPEEPRAK